MNAIKVTVIANGTSTDHFLDTPVTAQQLLGQAAFVRQFGLQSNAIAIVNGESGLEHSNLAEGDTLEFEARAGSKGAGRNAG